MEGPLFIRTPRSSDTLPVAQDVLLADDPSSWGCEEECGTEAYNIAGFEGAPRLVYSRERSTERRSPKIGDLLSVFIRLDDAQPADVLSFANRWGTLGLCEDHGLPITHGCNSDLLGELCRFEVSAVDLQAATVMCCHRKRREQLRSPSEHDAAELKDWRASWYWEPVSVWRDFALAFRSILRVASCLGKGRIGRSGDWKSIFEVSARFYIFEPDHQHLDGPIPEYVLDKGSVITLDTDNLTEEDQREILVLVVDHFLTLADLTPRLTWSRGDSAPQVVIHVDDAQFEHMPATGWLFPALMSQLCAALSSPLGVFVCDLCGSPFTPLNRRPRADRRCYCPPCSLDASLASKREWWRRNRSRTVRDRVQRSPVPPA